MLHSWYSSTYARAVAAIGVASLAYVWTSKYLKKRSLQAIREAFPNDVVILHTIGKGPYAPSLSPFVMKLETFLRMAKVPYQIDESFDTSSKGKWPWITLNQRDIADSEFCIIEIKKHFNVDLDSHLSSEKKAIGHTIKRMTDEAFFWDLVMSRWVIGYRTGRNYDLYLSSMVPYIPHIAARLLLRSVNRTCLKYTWAQGIGRHTDEEVQLITEKDLKAYSDILGSNLFMLSSQPSEVDACVFAQLAQVLWHEPGTPIKACMDGLPNLVSYCERMKEKFYPDWDELTLEGEKKHAAAK